MYKIELHLHTKYSSGCGQLDEKEIISAYKADTTAFPGTVADVSTFIRQAVTGKTNSPDLYSVMQILGYDRTVARIKAVMESL